GRMPKAPPPLRTQGRTLPRFRRHRRSPHQLPQTHQVKRRLTAAACRVLLPVPCAHLLVLPAGGDRRLRVVAPVPLAVAVVLGLARHFPQIPAGPAQRFHVPTPASASLASRGSPPIGSMTDRT